MVVSFIFSLSLWILAANASRGNFAEQVFHFGPAFAADGEAVQNILCESELQRFIHTGAEFTGAEDLHTDNAFAGRLHLLEDADDGVRVGVHGRLGGIETGEIDLDPGFGGGGLERVERVAGNALRADDALGLRLVDGVHGSALFDVPILVHHAVKKQDVDVVRFQFAAETVDVRFHFRMRIGAGLGEQSDLVAWNGGERASNVGVGAVLVGRVKECYALVVAGAKKIGQTFDTELAGLIGRAADTVGPRTLRQAAENDFAGAERDTVGGGFLFGSGEEVMRKLAQADGRASGCFEKLASLHSLRPFTWYDITARAFFSMVYLAFLLLLSVPLAAQERWQARSMVITPRGIAATSQTLASQAGAQILARGGSAVDAAIAANAVLAVVEPMMCGLGGDLFAIHHEGKTGTLTGINASGWSGKGQTLAAYKAKGLYGIPSTGIHTVTVPGAVDGWWQMHRKFGKLPWADLFQPAIYYARNGYPVTEVIQEDWASLEAKLQGDVNARKYWLVDGRAPKVGQLFRIPALAEAFTVLARDGRDAFYRGPIAASILKTSARLGGTLAASDFAEFSSEWIAPVSVNYRGWTVYEMPPNGQGIAALLMLNLMERFPLPSMEQRSAEAMHIKIEAQKLAYRDLHAYVADPRQAKVPVEGLLAKSYAAARARGIDLSKANCDARPGEPEPGHTVYLSVVDKEGNAVSWIQSISDMWGSGVAVDDFAFHLHDRGGNFSSDVNHPNALAARKRPFHTIIPGFMEKDGQKIAFGIMRGGNQAQAHAQFVSHIVDHKMNIQAALEAPRFTRRSVEGCGVMMESRLETPAMEGLKTLGHFVDWRAEYSGQMGGGQAVLLDRVTGMHYGASSPRKDGAAIPEPDPYFTPAGNNSGKRP